MELVFFKGIKWIQEKIKVGQEYIAFGKRFLLRTVDFLGIKWYKYRVG
jgi:hypothetical protein